MSNQQRRIQSSEAVANSQLLKESLISSNASEQLIKQVAEKKVRLTSLDVHRGLTMIGMIIADYCGPEPWWFIDHAEWNGLTSADLVFPSFIFIMGFAVSLAVTPKNPFRLRTIFRIFALMFIGTFLQGLQRKLDFSVTRIPCILFRSGLCYGVVVLTHWLTKYGRKDLRIWGALPFVVFPALYLAFMLPFQNVQIGCPHENNFTQFCNFGAYIDRMVFTKNHMMWPNDPEGLWSTLNAFVTCYLGYYFSLIMKDNKDNVKKTVITWLIISVVFGALAYPLTLLIPINKKMWSTSYTFLTIGTTGLFLSFFVWAIDMAGKSKPKYQKFLKIVTQPVIRMGRNPLLVWIIMDLYATLTSEYIHIDGMQFQVWLYQKAFASWIPDRIVASTVLDMVYVVFFMTIAWFLFKFNIFLKL